MPALRTLPLPAPLVVALLLLAPAAFAQHKAAPQATTAAVPAPQAKGPVETETLSGLDLLPNHRDGGFAVRIKQRISQPATLRLTDTKTSRLLRTELLEPSAAATRAVNVGKLVNGEYKIEVLLPDTVYWKTVRVTHTRTHSR